MAELKRELAMQKLREETIIEENTQEESNFNIKVTPARIMSTPRDRLTTPRAKTGKSSTRGLQYESPYKFNPSTTL
jgi:hypothetical protein